MDYKDTIRIPKTKFPMKADLKNKSKEILALWDGMNLYESIRASSIDKKKFVLHDGPPYANGHIHIGHAMNKTIKDIIVKAKQFLGYNAAFVPGWDCHGLPIEWKIEEKFRKNKVNKETIDVVDFRSQCRDFARDWMAVQSREFQSLGILADFKNPYYTMSYDIEADIVKEIFKFVSNDSVYTGLKPIMWSVVEKTALAEAEVEYKNHVSTAITVKFNIIKFQAKESWVGADILIWTTTPWTIPANRALAFGADIEYSLVECKVSKATHRFVIATNLIESALKEIAVEEYKIIDKSLGLAGAVCRHPLYNIGYTEDRPLLEGDFVTEDAGTGIVHIAPTHGEDDWKLGLANNIEMTVVVDESGIYSKEAYGLEGTHIFKAPQTVVSLLREHNGLLSAVEFSHSYPHSWRSGAPLIYRLAKQIFIDMNSNDLLKKSLNAIEGVNFFPKESKVRFLSMLGNRPNWCISRQRIWGVPIAIFVNKETNKILKDQEVFSRIYKAFQEHGADIWFSKDPYDYIKDLYNPQDYEIIYDVIDVWFDSGASSSYVLSENKDLSYPADLYLEGSDQHRGWFQSSLLEAIGSGRDAPFKTIVTHGFTLDDKGQKMSKSKGNVISPEDINNKYGADILRIWVANCNYKDDVRISFSALDRVVDSYRKIRNTIKYLISNTENEAFQEIPFAELPPLEKFILNKLKKLECNFIECFEGEYDIHILFANIHKFCRDDLSSIYFDIRRDCLYCAHSDDPEFKASTYAMHLILNNLLHFIAPIMSFTAEEAFLYINKDRESYNSIFLNTKEDTIINNIEYNQDLEDHFDFLKDLRSKATQSMEALRLNKEIKSSLEASISLEIGSDFIDKLSGINLEDFLVVSEVILKTTKGEELKAHASVAAGNKCNRCWKIHKESSDICNRCKEVIST